MRLHNIPWILLVASLLLAGCSTVREVPAITEKGFTLSEVPADSVLARIPDYSDTLSTVRGKGKAIVSEPENSERLTLYFSGNRQKSLITIKNSLGIEGGQILSDGDSLLIYNKVDKYARKIPINAARLNDINNLASVNLVELLNMPVGDEQVEHVLESDDTYLLQLQSGGKIYVGKQRGLIRQVNRPASGGVPYSQITYDAYRAIEGLKLPRRITIFSADRQAKVDLLVQSLEVNPELEPLVVNLPDDIKIYRR